MIFGVKLSIINHIVGLVHKNYTYYTNASDVPRSLQSWVSTIHGCTHSWRFSTFYKIPFIFFSLLFSLPRSHHSDPGSHSRLCSLLPTTVRASHFCREKKSALLSSTRVEMWLPTLFIGALSKCWSFFFFANSESHTAGFGLEDQHY